MVESLHPVDVHPANWLDYSESRLASQTVLSLAWFVCEDFVAAQLQREHFELFLFVVWCPVIWLFVQRSVLGFPVVDPVFVAPLRVAAPSWVEWVVVSEGVRNRLQKYCLAHVQTLTWLVVARLVVARALEHGAVQVLKLVLVFETIVEWWYHVDEPVLEKLGSISVVVVAAAALEGWIVDFVAKVVKGIAQADWVEQPVIAFVVVVAVAEGQLGSEVVAVVLERFEAELVVAVLDEFVVGVVRFVGPKSV